MLNIIVCIKQVPMVSELPWNSKTGTLKRELAEGMMDPASRRALEAALQIKENLDANICAVTMGPAMAEEILHQAKALGADEGVLLTDRRMAGADTFLTSHILSRFIQREYNSFDLVICGSQTSDSETAQVGPQLAEDLGIPAIGYINKISVKENTVEVQRHWMIFLKPSVWIYQDLLPLIFLPTNPDILPLKGWKRPLKILISELLMLKN